MPSGRNNLSRDNLLNSSDNLATDDGVSSARSDVIDSNDIVLIEKPSIRSTAAATRDTITYETEKEVKKSPPSSSTPLLYANNVQSYQHAQPISEQLQQKSAQLESSPFKDFYEGAKDDQQNVTMDETKPDFTVVSISEEAKEESSATSMNTNPFFNSNIANSVIDRDVAKGKLLNHDESCWLTIFIYF